MQQNDLKKLLASLGVAGLISAGGMTPPAVQASGNGGSG